MLEVADIAERQRLLFRVLHAISLYFPETGYVQGMASIAAMFLNYFDEEQAFIMLVRVWELRGLETLYKTGFEGLMSTLETFERKWLAGGAISRKLVSPAMTFGFIETEFNPMKYILDECVYAVGRPGFHTAGVPKIQRIGTGPAIPPAVMLGAAISIKGQSVLGLKTETLSDSFRFAG